MNSPLTFSDCVVILNPDSTGYKRAKKQIAAIERHFEPSDFKQYTLRKADYDKPDQLLALLAKLSSTSLLVIGSGDGTINMILNLLFDQKISASNRKATIFPLWGGNASDIAHMLNGNKRTSVDHILTSGQQQAIHPLVYTDSNRKQYALAYISIGAVATTAKVLDDSPLIASSGPLRWLRFPLEVGVGLVGLSRARRFKVSLHDNEQMIYDALFINGRRIAKVYQTPGSLTEAKFICIILNRKHPVLLTHLSRLFIAWFRKPGKTDFSMKVLEDATLQIDGEVSTISAGANISIHQSSQPIYVLATKL